MRIMLDAGHDGKRNISPCKTEPRYYESVAMWTLTELLAKELEGYGVEVGKTRQRLEDKLDVNARGALARGYDLFLSMHTNAAGSAVKDGTDRPAVIYPVGATQEQISFANAIALCAKNVIGTLEEPKNYSRSYKSDPDTDYFGVIRSAVGAGCPAAFIVESSFHTDTRATRFLLSDENLRTLARAYGECIAEFFGLSQKESEPFLVRVEYDDLNIRTGAGTNFAKTGKTTGKGVFTIVEERSGVGSKTGWGRLKSGAGWIALDFVRRL